MSDVAVRWALSVRAPSATAKLLLWPLANIIRPPHYKAWTSASTLAAMTGLDRKTVLRGLQLLEQAGLIIRLPEQAPQRGGGPVWRLAWVPESSELGSTKSGTGSSEARSSEAVPLFPETSTAFPANSSHFSRKPVPKAGHKKMREGNEQKKEKRESNLKRSRRCPASFEISPELRAWASERFPQVNVDEELESMRDHEFEKPHNDWPATFRTWVKNADKFAAGRRTRTAGRARAETSFAETDYREGLPS